MNSIVGQARSSVRVHGGLLGRGIVQRGDIQAVIQNQMQQVIKQQSGELQQHVESGEDSSKPKAVLLRYQLLYHLWSSQGLSTDLRDDT